MEIKDIQQNSIPKAQKETFLCKEIARAVNGPFDYKAFAQRMGEEHPTVQQLMFRLMQTSMIFMASGAIHIDDRNRASFELCTELVDILRKHHLPLI